MAIAILVFLVLAVFLGPVVLLPIQLARVIIEGHPLSISLVFFVIILAPAVRRLLIANGYWTRQAWLFALVGCLTALVSVTLLYG